MTKAKVEELVELPLLDDKSVKDYETHTNGFRMLPSYYKVIRPLPDRERLALYDAIMDFGFGNNPAKLHPILNGYLQLMLPTSEKSVRFEEKQKANGRKGGRPRKSIGSPEETQVNPDETQSDSGRNVAVALANAVAIEKGNYKRKKRCIPASVGEVEAYCRQRGNSVDAKRFFESYAESDWIDSNGKPVLNWKQKLIQVWEPRADEERAKRGSNPDLSWRQNRYHAEDEPDV